MDRAEGAEKKEKKLKRNYQKKTVDIYKALAKLMKNRTVMVRWRMESPGFPAKIRELGVGKSKHCSN